LTPSGAKRAQADAGESTGQATERPRTRTPALATFDTTVVEAVLETPDATTLVLDIGSRAYRAGQYVSIDPHQFAGLQGFVAFLEHLKGRREPPRAYSMSSAPHEPLVAITIKEENYQAGTTAYPPLLSGFLVHHVRAAARLIVRGFIGAYVLPDDVESRTDHILHLCAGSGSVPNLSILKDSLHRHARLRHTFMYSNRTWQDVIFRDALARLRTQHPRRLRVIHTLTRETAGPHGEDVRSGRITLELLRATLADEPQSLVYACGPAVTVWERRACAAQGTSPTPRFLEAMLSLLDALRVPRERIRVESYG
jgi:3-ketosteroid 9alpha-monooxygenase subunit B